MMSDIIFVTPNLNGYVREEPVGTLLLSTILTKACFDVKILPFYHFGDIHDFDCFLENAVNEILTQNPKIVSFYTRCDTFHISIKIAQRIKRKSANIYIVFGGPQADITAEDTLRAIREIDYICCGEGETTVIPLFSSLMEHKPNHEIPGLVFRKDEQIVHNPRPALIKDLDTLPPIDYSLIDVQNNGNRSYVRSLFPVDVGRGCPFACTFCSTKTFWGRSYRLKSADRIISEIKRIHSLFGVSSFNFEHDMFTMDRKRVIQICNDLINIGFPVSWRCSARLDCLNRDLIDIMTAAGMNTLFVGIESGSPQMQKKIRKNLKLDDVYEKLSYISAKGVRITASFIFGFPDETEEEFSQTIALMVRLSKIPNIHLQHHLCTLFSGTELTQKYQQYVERATLYSDTTGEIAVQECADLINAHPTLFPHYFEYKSDLREKIKYFPQFFDSWMFMRPVYEYIALHYYGNRYCDMLYDFSDCNREILESEKDLFTILQKDCFLDCFKDDKNYELLTEISKFFLWRADPHTVGRNIFGFDIKALLAGDSISDIQPKLTMVSCEVDHEGKRKITLYNKANLGS